LFRDLLRVLFVFFLIVRPLPLVTPPVSYSLFTIGLAGLYCGQAYSAPNLRLFQTCYHTFMALQLKPGHFHRKLTSEMEFAACVMQLVSCISKTGPSINTVQGITLARDLTSHPWTCRIKTSCRTHSSMRQQQASMGQSAHPVTQANALIWSPPD